MDIGRTVEPYWLDKDVNRTESLCNTPTPFKINALTLLNVGFDSMRERGIKSDS